MNETLKRIGLELRRRYQSVLRLPMNWRMIDAFVRLEEADERRGKDAGSATPAASDGDVRPGGNVVDLPGKRRE